MKNRLTLLLFTTIFITTSISCLEDKPLWVEFQEAKSAYENGDFQEALNYFLEVTKSPTPFPEAEYMIGMLYLEEGELDVAEEQIKKAIDLAHYLQVDQDLFTFKYSLAKVYILKEDYDNYIYTLKDIIGREEIDLQEIRDQKAYYDTILESGIDRLLHLYRKEADNVVNARVYLGYYYNSIGKYKESVNYLLSPMLALISEVIDDNILRDREYVFKSMTTFFEEVYANKRARDYFEEHDFYKLLYYLGESLYGLGHPERAKEIWSLLLDSNIESKWVNKSKKQIKNPVLEDWKFIY